MSVAVVVVRRAALAWLFAIIAGCATHPAPPLPSRLLPPRPSLPSVPAPSVAAPTAVSLTAPGMPLAPRPGFTTADLTPALTAFRASCPTLVKRADLSGLTQPGDWAAPCAAAATATDGHIFFAAALLPVVIGNGRGLDTGYYEPDLAATRTPAPGFAVPIYRRPPDLLDIDLGTFDVGLTGKHIRGRIAGARVVPYYDRAEIDGGALAGRGLELAWAADPYAAFFLEIQGSGRLRLTDGTTLRVGYDGQNGHAYTGIGKLLRDQGALGPGQATMAGIIGWLRAHPGDAPTILHANRSKIFFKPVDLAADRGPLGALGIALTPRVSVAADPAFVPLGAPLWLDTTVDGAGFTSVVVAQDTGGAIKGANRLDLFWGSGDAAGAVAGGITASGTVALLLPPVAVRRLAEAAAARRDANPAAKLLGRADAAKAAGEPNAPPPPRP